MPTIFEDKVTVNAVTFNDTPTYPSGAVKFCIDDIQGWDTRPSLAFQTTPKGVGVDGEFATRRASRKGRHMLVAGYVWGNDRATAEQLIDVLWRDAFPVNTELELTRYESVPKFINATVSAEGEITKVGPDKFRFTVPLFAGDPFKYGALALSGSAGAAGQSSGGRTYPRTYPLSYATTTAGEGNSIVLVNTGTTSSYNLQLTLTGPLVAGGWHISNETTGETISFDTDVASTDTLVINFPNGEALLNGYPIGSTIVGDFWALVPGENVIKLFANYNPAVLMSAIGYSAWE